MNDFILYLGEGLLHIGDFQAYDHMLFIISLCAFFHYKSWRKVVILITAFTVGHSITLALSVLDLVNIDSILIESLIPLTIIITCCLNIYLVSKSNKYEKVGLHYLLALIFGLVHGLGFANYLRIILGDMNSLIAPLFSFNLGIELGQLAIVLVYFLFYYLLQKLIKFSHIKWVRIISSGILIIAAYLFIKSIPSF